jgi:hypothetical protein
LPLPFPFPFPLPFPVVAVVVVVVVLVVVLVFPLPLPLPLPFPLPLLVPFVAAVVVGAWVGHAPSVSPWRRCAGTALAATEIVWNGFFLECVRWQMRTLYWYCAADGLALPTAAELTTARDAIMAVARPSAEANRSLLLLTPSPFPSPLSNY